MEGFEYEEVWSAQANVATTGDKYVFVATGPVDIIRWGIVADANLVVGAGMVIKGDKVNAAGTRGDGNVGTITHAALVTAPAGLYTENVSPAEAVNKSKPHRLIAGERLVLEVTDAADTSGTGHLFVHYKRRPFQPGTIVAASSEIRLMTKKTA